VRFLNIIHPFITVLLGGLLFSCVNTDEGGGASNTKNSPATPGSIDNQFGSGANGTATISISSIQTSSAEAVVALSNGKFIIAADTRPTGRADHDFTLIRFNSDASVDTTFNSGNNGGIAETDLDNFSGEIPSSMVIDSNGKILVSGHQFISGGASTGWNIISARFNNNGQLDSAYGNNNSGFSSNAYPVSGTGSSISYSKAMALFPDDSLVIAGRTNNGGSFFDMMLARYDATGILIDSFNPGPSGGFKILGFDNNGEDHANAVAVQGNPSTDPDNSTIFMAGYGSFTIGGKNLVLAKYDMSGELDTSFNSNGPTPGMIVTNLTQNDSFNAIAIQKDGKIVVAGTKGYLQNQDIILIRYTTAGENDSTFNNGEFRTIDIAGFSDEVTAVAIDSQDRIIIAGTSQTSRDPGDFVVARFLNDGGIDENFGDGGIVLGKISDGKDIVNAIALDRDGIILAGTANLDTTQERIGLMRVYQ